MTRVLMTGYYGRANFGDDVLMSVTYHVLREAMPSAEIFVRVDGPISDYVASMLPNATLLSPGYHGAFDYIVHGGGGVFFDFDTHGLPQRMIEWVVEAAGYPAYLALEKTARALLHKPRTHARRRLGLGIGVGTFSPGSPRLREKLHALADFDALWVRDGESIENLKRFSSLMRGEIFQGSDLAFLTQHWMPHVPPRAASDRIKLGVILRDWPVARGGIAPETLQPLLTHLAAEFDLTCFLFDETADRALIPHLAPHATILWRPATQSIAQFSAALATQHVLVTARAHGAICGACLGVPSVILPIEPKLAQVHAMLPNASVLGHLDSTDTLCDAIRHAASLSPTAITADVARGRAASHAALEHLSRWFT